MTDPTRALERLEQAEKAMTHKPWYLDTTDYGADGEIDMVRVDFIGKDGRIYPFTPIVQAHTDKADAAGIALLRNCAPALIACARALEANMKHIAAQASSERYRECCSALAALSAAVGGGT